MTNLEKLYGLNKDLIKARNKIYFAEMLDEIKTAFIEIHGIRIELHKVIKRAHEEHDPEMDNIKEKKGGIEKEINETVNVAKAKALKIYNPEFYTRAEIREIVDMEV